jgi:hypothetical protein
MLDHFSYLHLPALLTATPMFLGGLFHGLLKPEAALLTWGMTPFIARTREAQIVYYGHTMRTSTLGLLMFVLYFQGNLEAVDVVMAVMGAYCGIADVLMIWWFGERKVVLGRLVSIIGIAAWGVWGGTARSRI